jgi:hypothetical protein
MDFDEQKLVGTWQDHFPGMELMSSPVLYTFNSDGTGVFRVDPVVFPFRWRIIEDGRLRISGARGVKGMSTHVIALLTDDRLVLCNRRGREDGVLRRVLEATDA